MKQIYTSVFLLLFVASGAVAQQTSVLFLGNSYIYTANLPGTLYNLALEGGDTIYHESNTPGGYTFEGHSTNTTTLSKISSRDWDFVILQEQSQRPSFPDGQVASQVYPYAEILVDSIKSNYECTEPLFFMTWGRRDGDAQNCAGFPPLCTYEGMQERLRNAYLQMTFDNEATVAPCGAAWQQMALVDNFFWNGLYSGDGSHPSAWGTYLNACVFYATILRKSPVGIEYYSSIGQTDAEVLQQLAEDIVLDSLTTWNIGHADPVAVGDFSFNGNGFEFTNSSVNAEDHYWDFGDGNFSEDANPTHIFGASSVYEVMYIASSPCNSDTTYISVDVATFLSTNEVSVFEDVSLIQDDSGSRLENRTRREFELNLFNPVGQLVYSTSVEANSSIWFDDRLNTGLNLIQVSTEQHSKTYKVLKR